MQACAAHKLTSPSYVFLLAGLGLSYVGDAAYSIGLVWLAITLTHSPSAAGLVYALEAAPAVLLSPIAGALVDSLDLRRLMIGSDLLRAALLLAVYALASAGHLQAGGLFLFALLLGIPATVYPPALRVFMRSTLAAQGLAAANAVVQSLERGAYLVGSALAGLAIVRWGATSTLLADALSFLIMALCLSVTPLRAARPAVRWRLAETWQSVRDGLTYVRTTPPLLLTALLLFATNLIVMPVNVVLPKYSQLLGAGAQGFGLLVSLISAGALAGAPFAPWLLRALGYRLATASGLSAMALAFCALGAFPSLAVAAAAMVVIGAALPAIVVPVTTWIQHTVPLPLQGRTFATNSAITRLALPLAFSGAGALVAHVSVPAICLGTAIVLSALAVVWAFGFAVATGAPLARGDVPASPDPAPPNSP